MSRRRQVMAWCLAAFLLVAAPTLDATAKRKQEPSVAQLVKHAHGKAGHCNRGGRHSYWSVTEVRCAIVVYSKRRGMSPSRVDAIVRCESGYDPKNRNGSSGAMGLTQFLPSTWRGLSERGRSGSWLRKLGRYAEQRDPYDPVASLRAMYVVWRSDGRSYREWVCASLV